MASGPSAKRVALRTLVLSAVTLRAYLENEGADDTAEYHQKMLDWIDRPPMREEFERAEWSFVRARIGKLNQKKVSDALWRSEGLGVLAWALGYGKLPPYDKEADQQRMARRLGFMGKPVVLTEPKLRPVAERRKYADLARAIHWRLRELRLRPGAVDLAKVKRFLPFVTPLTRAGVRRSGGDLALGGRPIHQASPGEIQHALSIAAERHLAANWLLGTSSKYSDVDTPT